MFCEFFETSIEESFIYCPECDVELDQEEVILNSTNIFNFMQTIETERYQFPVF